MSPAFRLGQLERWATAKQNRNLGRRQEEKAWLHLWNYECEKLSDPSELEFKRPGLEMEIYQHKRDGWHQKRLQEDQNTVRRPQRWDQVGRNYRIDSAKRTWKRGAPGNGGAPRRSIPLSASITAKKWWPWLGKCGGSSSLQTFMSIYGSSISSFVTVQSLAMCFAAFLPRQWKKIKFSQYTDWHNETIKWWTYFYFMYYFTQRNWENVGRVPVVEGPKLVCSLL